MELDTIKAITDVGSVRGDEYFTLEPQVVSIAENLIRDITIWCPFNDTNSNFPKVLRAKGFTVVTTDGDFFTTDPPPCVNAIVSNPPFSLKTEVLKRCKELNLKFALLLPFLYLNDGVPLDYGHQIMLWRKRMKFEFDGAVLSKPRTNCFVLSNGILQHDLHIVW